METHTRIMLGSGAMNNSLVIPPDPRPSITRSRIRAILIFTHNAAFPAA